MDTVYADQWMSEVAQLTELTSTDFKEFFCELWKEKGHRPFMWQMNLAKRVIEGVNDGASWPEAIALPTATGKTTCIDIAVFALAVQADKLSKNMAISAPRRIFFVVDRRTIVDQAYNRATEISRKIRSAKSGILKEVADRLRKISNGGNIGFEDKDPLSAYVLRGGMYRSEAWARDPLQPTIVASTVDQIGSRLLFRAYGHRQNTWPIYAGLVANDSIIFLDEAHCAQPFLQTLQSVQRFRRWALTPLNRPFYPVIMSATPPTNISDVFKDDSNDKNDPNSPLYMRQHASKRTRLIVHNTGDSASLSFPQTLAKVATGLITDEFRSIVIFVNRVMTAREVYQILCKNREIDQMLLTGRMRQIEKTEVVKKLKSVESSGSKQRLKKPLVVVATQTLEVGADLDFDCLVTECASLDSLRQRFGRLNRMGHHEESNAIVIIRDEQTDHKYDDPIYGTALAKTWAWLNKIKKHDEIDFGIIPLEEKISDKELDELNAPSLDAPVMLPAHIDCWSQTSPKPIYSPDVIPFLRGPKRGGTDIQVCWRDDLDIAKKKHVFDSLRICPPSSVETISVPIGTLKSWLTKKASKDSSDVEGLEKYADVNDDINEEHRVIAWRGVKNSENKIVSKTKEIKPGYTIIVPFDNPLPRKDIGDFTSTIPQDIGDYSHLVARAKPILRLHRNTIQNWPSDFAVDSKAVRDLLDGIRTKYDEDYEQVEADLLDVLNSIAMKKVSGYWEWLPEVAAGLIKEYKTKGLHNSYSIIGDDLLVITGRHRIQKYAGNSDTFGDEDDYDSSGTSHKNGRPVKLEEHLYGVEEFARRYARGCGLSEDMINAIASAGRLHDLGKIYLPFQSLLKGKKIWSVKENVAKSPNIPRNKKVRDKIKKDVGYPKDWRHELLSVRLAESVDDLLPVDESQRDLSLHLITSHHGYCRPFALPVLDETPIKSSIVFDDKQVKWCGPTNLELVDSGIAERYWLLTRQYGWWGLAWLEAILRLADWRRSEWEENNHGG